MGVSVPATGMVEDRVSLVATIKSMSVYIPANGRALAETAVRPKSFDVVIIRWVVEILCNGNEISICLVR